jgi:glycosyltransferase involved in cell wall biosynthesis
MRILIVNEALTGAGGVETYLATLIPAMQQAGHEVGVLHDNPAAQGGPQRIAPEGIWRAGISDDGLDPSLARVRDFAPDVVFSHNMRRLAYSERVLAEWPVVKMMHGHFGTCVSGQKAFSFPSVVACTRTFGPGCLAHYLPRRCGHVNPIVMMEEYGWGRRLRGLFPRYSAIVVASHYMRSEYLRAGVAPDKVHAIPLFASPPPAGDTVDEGTRPIDAVFLGRMTPLKGPDILLEAAVHASVRLGRRLSVVFAGEGPERARLAARAPALPVDARFPGWLDAPARDQLLRDASIIAVPSRWAEPFALVGLEAGFFGTPAVGFDAGGISDWLVDRENGRLIGPTRGAAGFGDAIAEILADPELRRRLGSGARETAVRFSVANHLRQLMPVLERAASSRSVPPKPSGADRAQAD